MNPKTFLAFALGCFLAGGAGYLLSRPPAAAAPPAKVDAVPPIAEAAAAATKPPVEAAPMIPVVAPEPAVARALAPAPQSARRARSGFRPVSEPSAASKPAAAVPAAPIPAVIPVVTPEPAASAPQPLKAEMPPPPPPPPAAVKAVEAPKANVVTIEAGTMLTVRLREPLSSERNHVGDAFRATLDQPVVVDGFVIAERGASVEGKITELDRSGRVKGLARLVLELTSVSASDGQSIRVQTSAHERKAEDSKKSDVAKVGIGAAIGAAIGGIAGGGKGAAAGAGAGGAAGAGQVLLTRGKAAELAVEARVSFRLRDPVTLTERLGK